MAELVPVCGVVKIDDKGNGVLRDPARSFKPSPQDARISRNQVARYALQDGATVRGVARVWKQQVELETVETICGLTPDEYRARPRFSDLVAIDPHERFQLGITGEPSMRVVDVIAPIGRGTRGLIVSPPKAGKTMLLEQIARAIRSAHPTTRVIALLVDERPEEVTHFRRAVDVEVLASSNDQSVDEHVELAELTLAMVRTELECGRDLVVLIDSLTRMGRAFNIKGSGSGRTLSGGLEAGALDVPRRFFGLARAIEGGGTVTIIATALIDTGSRMDELIFQEFKGTGNCEIVLDRHLAEQRIFPAINVNASGTRKEARLFTPTEYRQVMALRRFLSNVKADDAMRLLLMLMEKYPDNTSMLENLGTFIRNRRRV
ncbi:MAG: transcription termination factor Rho [bacterium]|nr:transcription termination factor Rho [bacterium]